MKSLVTLCLFLLFACLVHGAPASNGASSAAATHSGAAKSTAATTTATSKSNNKDGVTVGTWTTVSIKPMKTPFSDISGTPIPNTAKPIPTSSLCGAWCASKCAKMPPFKPTSEPCKDCEKGKNVIAAKTSALPVVLKATPSALIFDKSKKDDAKGDKKSADSKQDKPKRALPNRQDYANRNAFILDQYRVAYETGGIVQQRIGLHFGYGDDRWVRFENQRLNIAVDNMYGCTAVVIVSRGGAYIAHFFERAFQPSVSEQTFKQTVLDTLANGEAYSENNQNTVYMTGLNALTGPGGMFHPSMQPVAYVITPLLHGGDGVQLQYYNHLVKIQTKLRELLGPSAYITHQDYQAYRDRNAGTQQQIAAYDAGTSKGKFIVQYDPSEYIGQDGNKLVQMARARLLVQDRQDPYDFTWAAIPDQIQHTGQ